MYAISICTKMKKRNLLLIILSVFVVFTLASCKKTKIELSLDKSFLELNMGETYKVEYESNDDLGVSFISKDDEVATVNSEGLVTAVNKGTTSIVVTSKTDNKVFSELKITVDYGIEFNLITKSIEFEKGETYSISANTTAENGLIFKSLDESIVTVDEEGTATAINEGSTSIEVFPKDFPILKQSISVVVTKQSELVISTNQSILIGHQSKIEINLSLDVSYTSSNEEVLTVTEDGFIQSNNVGISVVTVSSIDGEFSNSIEIHIVDNIIVSKLEEEIIAHEEKLYETGITHFNSLLDVAECYQEALNIFVLDGKYDEEAIFTHSVIITGSDKSIIAGTLKFKGDDVSLTNLEFNDNGKIILAEVNNFEFNNNKANNVAGIFIKTSGTVGDITIENNEFNNVEDTVIKINKLNTESVVKINKNKITNSGKAIQIVTEEKMTRRASITIYRNIIDKVETAFVIDLNKNNNTGSYKAYGRFNEVTNYEIGIQSETNGNFEWTLNYWGEMDYTKFINVNQELLLGNYEDPSKIVTEKEYRPSSVYYFELLNPIEQIELGETHKYEFITLPYSADNVMNWIVSEVGHISINTAGNLIPIQSGEITLRAFPASNRSLEVRMPLIITTDPGIHLTPSITKQGLEVGDIFKIDAEPFPYSIKDNIVSFKSSNSNIATVDNDGNVLILSSGEFSITASLNSSPEVTQKLYFESYDELNDDNILDFIIKRQMQYSKRHEIEVYGAGFNFNSTHHESVARFLYGDVLIDNVDNDGNIQYIPTSPGVRPGTKKNSNIKEEYKFNPQNISWIVVHETANTSPGSGALSHHNYLLNRTNAGALDYTSWHMTIDSEKLYQHIPHDEIAWHAGDGSTLPGAGGSAGLGGGNRNGIGIEMGVNQDGNIMKTWQRTAKHAASLLDMYNMPFTQLKYHNSFSGKICPQSMMRAGLQPLFEEMALNEYKLIQQFKNVKSIELTTENEDFIESTGIILKSPELSQNLKYEVTITFADNQTISKTFNVYLPGIWK